MRLARVLTAYLAAAPDAAVGQESAHTSSIGMEFVSIQPGTMQVGVCDPFCPDPARPAQGFAGMVAPARGGESGRAPADPRALWTEADYQRCREFAAKDSSPGFPVKIAKPYFTGKFEVTQDQWKKVMGANPSAFRRSVWCQI